MYIDSSKVYQTFFFFFFQGNIGSHYLFVIHDHLEGDWNKDMDYIADLLSLLKTFKQN